MIGLYELHFNKGLKFVNKCWKLNIQFKSCQPLIQFQFKNSPILGKKKKKKNSIRLPKVLNSEFSNITNIILYIYNYKKVINTIICFFLLKITVHI